MASRVVLDAGHGRRHGWVGRTTFFPRLIQGYLAGMSEKSVSKKIGLSRAFRHIFLTIQPLARVYSWDGTCEIYEQLGGTPGYFPDIPPDLMAYWVV